MEKFQSKYRVSELKNSLRKFNSRLDTGEERIGELKSMPVNIQLSHDPGFALLAFIPEK